jgi:predicted AAA+ superfamily ATPase
MFMILREKYLYEVRRALKRSPVVALIGPRQCGKTTLARQLLDEESPNYFDLEHPVEATLLEQPMTALEDLKGLVVLDEAQRQPGLFPVLRVLADRKDAPAKFLILGSASPELSRQASESLAGRVEIIEMRGFDLEEVSHDKMELLWQRGGFPRSFLAGSEMDSVSWRENFIRTFLERDLSLLGIGISPVALRRFWTMVSHYHGQIWNGSEIAASLGVAPNTAKAYLDALEQTFMIRRLQPWFENVGKRLVKTPKIYIRDSGILHSLQNIHSKKALLTHPKLGASWEGFALEEVLRVFLPREAYFYSIHSGSELDLFFIHDGKRIGVEFKRADAPNATRSMRIAIEDLKLDKLYIVYPGGRNYVLSDRIQALSIKNLHSVL